VPGEAATNVQQAHVETHAGTQVKDLQQQTDTQSAHGGGRLELPQKQAHKLGHAAANCNTRHLIPTPFLLA
jgi:hypothetical protein